MMSDDVVCALCAIEWEHYVRGNQFESTNTSVELLDVQVNAFCDVRARFVQLTFALSAVINATLIGPL